MKNILNNLRNKTDLHKEGCINRTVFISQKGKFLLKSWKFFLVTLTFEDEFL